jgi:hypothetical protein
MISMHSSILSSVFLAIPLLWLLSSLDTNSTGLSSKFSLLIYMASISSPLLIFMASISLYLLIFMAFISPSLLFFTASVSFSLLNFMACSYPSVLIPCQLLIIHCSFHAHHLPGYHRVPFAHLNLLMLTATFLSRFCGNLQGIKE